ncbi:MAG: RelA/SpoT family protein [Mariprofundales bacterium]
MTDNSTNIAMICEHLLANHAGADVLLVQRAYVFAACAHDRQKRKSGIAYVSHPLSVALTLAKDLWQDANCIAAALLHDTVEDTYIELKDVEQRFGKEVAKLVDGVTKIGRLEFESRRTQEAENYSKMIISIADDPRVLLVKLADRLHNMQTLNVMRDEKRRRIATETRDIYAPLAHWMGVHSLYQELSDLSFRYLEPDMWQKLSSMLEVLLTDDKDICQRVKSDLLAELETQQETLLRGSKHKKLHIEIDSRLKHPCSIYQKMRAKKITDVSKIEENIFDLMAFRIIVDDTLSCYKMLGIVHSMHTPLVGRFKDFIAIPKGNGYRSLHTVVHGPGDKAMEIQIRSRAMHEEAEYGMASHFRYKNKFSHEGRLPPWLHNLTKLRREQDKDNEFVEDVCLQLITDQVYIHTPTGEVKKLPRGATVLDYAYSIHTEIGDHAKEAVISGRDAEISQVLRSGDLVNIISDKNEEPKSEWLDIVITPTATRAIQQSLARTRRRNLLAFIRERIENALDSDVQKFLDALNYATVETLQAAINQNKCTAKQVQRHIALLPTPKDFWARKIMGRKLGCLKPSPCCKPIPGEDVVAHYRDERNSLLVHRTSCVQVQKQKELLWMPLTWEGRENQTYEANISAKTDNRPGVLTKITRIISDLNVNITNFNMPDKNQDKAQTSVAFTVHVRNIAQLEQLLACMRQIDKVHEVHRTLSFPEFNRIGFNWSKWLNNAGLRGDK